MQCIAADKYVSKGCQNQTFKSGYSSGIYIGRSSNQPSLDYVIKPNCVKVTVKLIQLGHITNFEI